MSDLIDRMALGIGKCNPDVFESKQYADGWNSCIKIIMSAPTVEAETVKRGEWRFNGSLNVLYCEKCGYAKPNKSHWRYCPNCGSKNEAIVALTEGYEGKKDYGISSNARTAAKCSKRKRRRRI